MAKPPFVCGPSLGDVPHGFFGRRGGVSAGPVASLQCGFGADDDEKAVAQNRKMACDAVLSGGKLVTPYQVHSADVVTVTEPLKEGERPKGDALVTDKAGIVLGIVTADCGPVLFADRQAGVIGAAHAGWRGAHGGILENTIAAMEGLGADRTRIAAAIGPTIAQNSYEVGAMFRNKFTADDARFFTPSSAGKAEHLQFDLPAYIAMRLSNAGIVTIDALDLDTYTREADYYSYRRATHQNAANYGRQLSLIGLGGSGS